MARMSPLVPTTTSLLSLMSWGGGWGLGKSRAVWTCCSQVSLSLSFYPEHACGLGRFSSLVLRPRGPRKWIPV